MLSKHLCLCEQTDMATLAQPRALVWGLDKSVFDQWQMGESLEKPFWKLSLFLYLLGCYWNRNHTLQLIQVQTKMKIMASFIHPHLYFKHLKNVSVLLFFRFVLWKSMGPKTTLDPTNFHCMDKNSWNFFFFFFLISTFLQESHTCLDQHEGE